MYRKQIQQDEKPRQPGALKTGRGEFISKVGRLELGGSHDGRPAGVSGMAGKTWWSVADTQTDRAAP